MKTPTFLLKPSAYKTNELYAIIPTDGNGDMNVSGYVGNGTRVNPQGFIEAVATDTPRIDYLGKPGLLVEPTRINQFLQSASILGQFAGANITVTDSDTIAPDGTKTADKTSDQTASTGSSSKNTTLSSPTAVHAHSLFVKFDDSEEMYWSVRGTVELDTSIISMDRNGVVTTVSDAQSQITSTGSEYYGNGWWRLWAVITLQPTDTGAGWFIYPATNDADRHGAIWAWGFQIEQGAFATSYIPTVATSVTRTADTVSLGSITTNGIIGAANGSFFIDFNSDNVVADSIGTIIYLGTTNGRVGINSFVSGQSYPYIRIQNTDASIDTQVLTTGRSKVLFNIAGDNVDVWANGVKVLSTAADFFLTNETLAATGVYTTIKIYEVAMFNKALTDTEAQAITS